MKLLSVEGSNIGLLRGAFSVEFNGSLTAITGPIGVGKSTLLMIIKASLTNSVPGSGASWVSWGAGKDEPSYFKAVWSLDDKILEIAKPMADTAAFKALEIPRIKVSDFEENVLFESFTSSGAAEILQTVLPVTAKVVDTHLVIDQDAIAHPTTATPAKFQETLHTLTKVNEIEGVRVKMRESLSSYAVPEVSELLETVTRDVSELESELAQKLKTKSEINDKLSAVDPHQLSEKIVAAEQAKASEERIAKLTSDIRETTTLVSSLGAEEAAAASQVGIFDKSLEDKGGQYEEDQQYTSAYTQLKAMWSRQEKVLDEIQAFEAILNSAVKPNDLEGDAPDESLIPPLEKERARLEAEVRLLTSNIKVCEGGVCPTCHQSTEAVDVGSLKARQNSIKTTLAELSLMLEAVSLKVVEHKVHQKALQEFEAETARITTEIESRQSTVDSSMKPVVEAEYLEAKARQEAYKACLAGKTNAANTLQAAVSRKEVYTQNLVNLQKELVDTSVGLPAFNPIEYQVLVDAQVDHQNNRAQLYALNESIKDKQSQVDKLSERKISVESRAAQAEPILNYRSTLEKSIEILKKDNLPKLLSAQYLGEINEKLQTYLTMVDAQFRAWIDNDLNFMVKKEDGLTHKANRLSGGQKQQASIAYLLSVNDVFASSLGVLILDEPTGSMQEENAKDVAEAFGKLLQVGKATNRQFIVVTHSKSLAAYSDQIVGMPLT